MKETEEIISLRPVIPVARIDAMAHAEPILAWADAGLCRRASPTLGPF